MDQADKREIICIGEILWDSLPSGLFLGGAPLNVSLHLHNLQQETSIVSRVGDDRLGTEALRRIKNKGISTGLIQVDEKLETGFVAVELDEERNPQYQIEEPAAWDYIQAADFLYDRLENAWGFIFGSLAQRNKITRHTVEGLFAAKCRKIFDINLRPPFVDRRTIESSLNAADILKMNEDELHQLAAWFDLPGSMENAVRILSQKFSCPIIAVTRGENGAVLLYRNEWLSHPGYKINVADTVGAGDAFTAALLVGIKSLENAQDILAFANAAGAYAASKNGAIPDYDRQKIRDIQAGNRSEEELNEPKSTK
jgi:fructokinase